MPTAAVVTCPPQSAAVLSIPDPPIGRGSIGLFAGRPAAPGTYGLVLTIHVDDVDEAYERAQRLGAEIAAEIRNEEYGQRHFLVVDPNGLLLNVMSAI